MQRTARLSHIATAMIGACSLSACTVGPNFCSPLAPDVCRYTETPLPVETVSTEGQGGNSQHYMGNQPLVFEWWRSFQCEALNCLIHRGLVNNPSIESAQAALRVAQFTLYSQIGSLQYPQVNIVTGADRQQNSGVPFGQQLDNIDPTTIFNILNAQINVSYTFDLFGGTRRQVEALCAQVDYQRYVLAGTTITLASNIATTAITEASLREQIKSTLDLIDYQAKQLEIIKQQFELGGVSKSDVLTQETLFAKTNATLPPLEKSLSQTRHALAALVGSFPDQSDLPHFHLDDITLPSDIPVSLPSALVKQRPDIQASEALLHQASAQIGVATANMLPQFTISGNGGWQANFLNQLFEPASFIWNIGMQALQPFFRSGSLITARKASIAAYEQACAQYKQTVLQAFQNVADSLRALDFDAKTLRAQKEAEDAALASMLLTEQQFRLGAVNYLSLLNAEQQYQQTVINRIQAQAARYTDTVALYQSLGGGWRQCG
jgi:NodT family efflux transporter outer membrane factor (OMF) lipoprotein